MPEAALSALAVRVGQARDALEGEAVPASMLGDLEAIRGLTLVSIGRLVTAGGFGPHRDSPAAYTEIAATFARIFEALADGVRAVQVGEKARVSVAVGTINAAVSEALTRYTRLKD